jgi:anhydro-N-acetylmuramic acid kinase
MAGKLFIGLMSGTSLDGVDAALVEFSDRQQPHVLHTHFVAYPSPLRSKILALQHPTENELETTALMANTLARLYADAVIGLLKAANISPSSITAIGCHGQTIRHRPELGFTMQIGNASLLAELTGITVVSDFRSRDIAAGGQGAPLVPAFHKAVFANNKTNRAIINIGGIANITYLASSGETFGFDSGPGNMLLDAWIKQHLNLEYDANGDWAGTGTVIVPLLSAMLEDTYFALTPPKSTGRDLFNNKWLNNHLINKSYQANDVAHTLVALTAHSIYNALKEHCGVVDEVYLCGGGAKNTLLTQHLQELLGNIKLTNLDELGIGIDWAEAIAFAWLAKQCLNQQTANLAEVTGAKGTRILGAIYQA